MADLEELTKNDDDDALSPPSSSTSWGFNLPFLSWPNFYKVDFGGGLRWGWRSNIHNEGVGAELQNLGHSREGRQETGVSFYLNYGNHINHAYDDAGDMIRGYESCSRSGHFHCSLPEREDLYTIGPPCQPNSRLNPNRHQNGNPFETPDGAVFLSASRHIRKRRPKAVILEEVVSVYDKFKYTHDTPRPEKEFFKQYPAPIDFMLRGRTGDGELVGLETIEGYNLQIAQLESANFGVPQTRARIYIIMVDAMLIDAGELQSLAHIICQVLPQSIPKEGCQIEDIMNYSYHVCQAFDQTPHMPPKSKDGKTSLKAQETLKALKEKFQAPTPGYTAGLTLEQLAMLNRRERSSLDIQHAVLCAKGLRPESDMCTSDLARSAGRLANATGGKVHALSTFVKIWSYSTGELLSAEDLFLLQGFDAAKLNRGDYGRFTYADLNHLAGNGWSVPCAASAIYAVVDGDTFEQIGNAFQIDPVPSNIAYLKKDGSWIREEKMSASLRDMDETDCYGFTLPSA